jgi:hypothetical protein
MNQRSVFRALAVALPLACIACSSTHDEPGEDNATGGVSTSDCSTRADTLALGSSKTSTSGARFSLSSMQPSVPVQSPGPPGNSWSIEIHDPNGVPLSGALNVTTFMPDHGHAGPPTIGVESQPGLYAIDELVFPMPALYAVTFTLTETGGDKASVAIAVCVEPSSG